jgi:hypothetical protein
MDNQIVEVNACAVAKVPQECGTMSFAESFRESYKMAQMIAKSSLIPDAYKGKVEDVTIAVDMAKRINMSPMMVLQNMYVVKGKPVWSGQACMAIIQNKFKDAHPVYTGKAGTPERACHIEADNITGPEVTMAMAAAEGWTSNSKWRNMPDQMLGYRAASFFARLYCPSVLMGMHTDDEVEDACATREVADVL